eukprot:4438615-Amphidinium_carterae.1
MNRSYQLRLLSGLCQSKSRIRRTLKNREGASRFHNRTNNTCLSHPDRWVQNLLHNAHTSRLERVLDQGNIPEQQRTVELQVARPVAIRDTPMNLQEAEAGQTPWIEEFPAPAGGWVSIDWANVQRLRYTEQGNPPPPEIVQETVMTEPTSWNGSTRCTARSCKRV